MFWERFTEECALKGVKPNQIADEIGVSSGTLTKWKKGALPNVDKLIAVSSYFGVTTDYLPVSYTHLTLPTTPYV